ncbi:MAG: choice-of-anchor L domain-containing protein [Candidatus Velamenicoccus archaeovorus]
MRKRVLGSLVTLATAAAFSVAMPLHAAADPGLSTQQLSETLTPADLAQQLAGTGVTVSNVSFTGADVAAGRFMGGGTGADAIVGFDQGVVLSTGQIASVVGPNQSDSTGTDDGMAGDADLSALVGDQPTFDAAVLAFDFVPNADTVTFRYVFASDEYNEFVNSEFNDVFGFFVNGTNCAMVDGAPVSINTINGGNPLGTDATHPELFRNNDLDDGGGTIDTEMDGLTTVLTCQASVTPNETNTMKLAIADTGDAGYDSNVFIEAGSLTTVTTHTLSVEVTGTGQGSVTSDPAGISCPGIEGPCSADFEEGTSVALTASAAEGSAFVGWGGDCEGQTGDICTVTMDQDRSVTARFDELGNPPGAPTDVTAVAGNASAVVRWTAPADTGDSPIDLYRATCTATGDVEEPRSADTTDGTATSVSVPGLTNGTEYTCTVQAHNDAGFGPASAPSNAVTPSDSSGAAVIDPAIGGTVDFQPTGANFLGTSAQIVLPPQSGSSSGGVVVSGFLFGRPGEQDATCGGKICIGQGLDWTIGVPTAFDTILVSFFESPALVGPRDITGAKVYKDGVKLKECKGGAHSVPPPGIGACVRSREILTDGTWKITVLANGDDPKGRL